MHFELQVELNVIDNFRCCWHRLYSQNHLKANGRVKCGSYNVGRGGLEGVISVLAVLIDTFNT